MTTIFRRLSVARLLALLLTLAPLPAWATPEGWSPLLEPAELAALLEVHGEEIRVFHVTGDHEAGHIPEAGWSPYAAWRSLGENSGALRDLRDMERVVGELGIEEGMPVVVVHAGTGPEDMGAAARVYWTLKSLGFEDLALLNGGFAAWVAAGLPVETGAVSFFPSDISFDWRDDWRATTREVAALSASGAARLLDSRPERYYRGEVAVHGRPGTVRGAENLSYTALFEGARMREAPALRALAEAGGLTDGTPLVTFCNAGHWSALTWFAFHELAGLEEVRLHAESMAEYGVTDLPMDNVPGRVSHYWRMTANWLAGLWG